MVVSTLILLLKMIYQIGIESMTYQTYTGEGDVGVAHQYLMRVERASEEKENLSFDPSTVSLDDSVIRPITRSEAKPIIERYEYLKCMPAISTQHFGIYFDTDCGEQLGGVLVYGPDYAKNLGHWDKYGYTDNMLLLSRGVCLCASSFKLHVLHIYIFNDWHCFCYFFQQHNCMQLEF